jgi:hypothetical protein
MVIRLRLKNGAGCRTPYGLAGQYGVGFLGSSMPIFGERWAVQKVKINLQYWDATRAQAAPENISDDSDYGGVCQCR